MRKVLSRPGTPPAPLLPGTYYWGVWALDNDGEPAASTVEKTYTLN